MRNPIRNLILSTPTLLMLLIIVILPSQAEAKAPAAGSYTAKTENGGKFSFKLSGKRISAVKGPSRRSAWRRPGATRPAPARNCSTRPAPTPWADRRR